MRLAFSSDDLLPEGDDTPTSQDRPLQGNSRGLTPQQCVNMLSGKIDPKLDAFLRDGTYLRACPFCHRKNGHLDSCEAARGMIVLRAPIDPATLPKFKPHPKTQGLDRIIKSMRANNPFKENDHGNKTHTEDRDAHHLPRRGAGAAGEI